VSDKVIDPISITSERLKRSEILNDLSEKDLAAIALFCREVNFPDGETVLEEGNFADKLHIVERGKLALEKKIELGRHSTARTATVGYIEPGKMAGFSTLIEPHAYSSSAVCIEPTRTIEIDGDKLQEYLTSHPEVGLKVMHNIANLTSNRYRTSINTLTYFLSIVSHELRSPLAAIENYLRTMLGGFAGDLTPKQERMVKRSIVRVTDLRALIGDVVDLARMRPEQIQADFDWFDPSEIGTESIEDVRLSAAEKNIKLNIDPPEAFEPIVGARRRLRQVFTNILSNAIKFSPEESQVTFAARYEPENVIFWVEDQGPGISEEDMPHLFKDFFRGANISGVPGTGLGLSITKKIMEAHNGDILVENLLDNDSNVVGAKFSIVIPRNLQTPKMRQSAWSVREKITN
jgi:signal transduction histidine kinase